MTNSQIVTIQVPSIDSAASLTIINFNRETTETLLLPITAPAFSGFCFSLNSDIKATLANSEVQMRKRRYQFITTPGGHGTITLSSGSHSVLLIQLPADFIALFRDSQPEAFDKVMSAIATKQYYTCFSQARRIPYEMLKTIDEIRSFKPTSEQFTHTFYYNKIVALVFQHIQNLLQEEAPARTQNCTEEIAMAEHLLKKEYRKNWTLDLLAETVGIHKRKLTDLFRQILGTSPMDYLNDFRLQKAFDLLANTSLPITDITRKIGYAHIQSFSRAFHRKYQASPQQCRKYIFKSDTNKMLPQT